MAVFVYFLFLHSQYDFSVPPKLSFLTQCTLGIGKPLGYPGSLKIESWQNPMCGEVHSRLLQSKKAPPHLKQQDGSWAHSGLRILTVRLR